MGANEREIIIRLRADGTAEVVDALGQTETAVKKTGQEAEASAKTTEKAGLAGKTAFWGLGQAAEELGQKVGITGQANRRLGNTVEDLAASVPRLAAVFGGLTLGLGVVLTVYDYLIERKKKLDQVTIASGESLIKEVTSMDKSWYMTNKMKDATMEMYEAKKKYAIFTETQAIKALQAEMIAMTDAHSKLGSLWDRITNPSGISMDEWAENLKTRTTKSFLEIGDKASELKFRIDQLQQLQDKGTPSKKDFFGDYRDYEKSKNDVLNVNRSYVEELSRLDMVVADQDRMAVDLAKARSESNMAIWEKELQAYDSMGAAKISAAKNGYEATKAFDEYIAGREIMILNRERDTYKQRMDMRADYLRATATGPEAPQDIGMADLQAYNTETAALMNAAKDRESQMMIWKTREVSYNKKMDEMKLQNTATVTQGIGQVMGMMYSLNNNKMKAFFYLERAAAAATAFINYQVAASQAVKVAGPFGIPMAAYFEALSYTVPTLIMEQSIAGGPGGGGGGGAIGTYSANPDTGGKDYKYFDYESSQYGTGWRPGENSDQGAGSQQVMQVTINAMDSKSFEKYVRDNPQAIQKLMKDIQGGYV